MQVTVTTNTQISYQFEELSDDAKERAREWFRLDNLDYDWWDAVYEDAKTVAGLMGIEISEIYFSGFSSQGDGACFTGSYSYAKGGLKAVKAYAPKDETLHNIATELQETQRPTFYQLCASVSHSGHYCHSGCMAVDVEFHNRYDIWPNCDQGDAIRDTLRSFADWIYRQLEAEYNYLNSDEAVDECIAANGYDFDEDGKIA